MTSEQLTPGDVSTYVYLLSNPFNLMPFYVGITNDLRQRLSAHAVQYSNHDRRRIIDRIRAVGSEPYMTVVDLKPSLEVAKKSELAWVEKFRRLGFPIVNRELPEESREAAVRFHLAALGAEQATGSSSAIGSTRRPPATAPAMRRARTPGKPENHGQPWSAEEVALVCSDFIEELPLSDIAQKHGRTRNGILSKLKQLSAGNPDILDRLVAIGELGPES